MATTTTTPAPAAPVATEPTTTDARKAVEAAERTTAFAAEVRTATAKQEENLTSRGLREVPNLPATGGATGLAQFDAYRKGSLAPWWLHEGVCKAWAFDPFGTQIRLITVSENATYAIYQDDEPFGVLRVSQPGYVGGPDAVESEMAWLSALHEVEGVNVVDDIPTASGSAVTTIADEAGTQWACVVTSFVEGAVLENLEDPSAFYRTIGRWTALFHRHSRSWRKPEGFKRFTWDIPDMIGRTPRWGRWEDRELTDEEYGLFKKAEDAALDVIACMPRTNETWGLIHADLRPSNIIAADDGTLTIIDFDDSGYSYFLYDFAAALSFVEHEPYAPAMAKAWIAGYQEIEPLSDQDLQCACALSMIRRLQMVGWTTNHYADALPDGLYDAQVPGTVTVARNYLRNPLWLLS